MRHSPVDDPREGQPLDERLRDLAAVALELAHEHVALAERLHRHYDELEQLAANVYANEQDLAGLLGSED